ncbi:hypothetical protein MA16_Dca002714 [Dendrobium catenatum]|uniref:Uncharacterized protein n=1 Tax=Dendrobium catenatum TaxID=906689 RepID=A0A2I0X8H8_9ASPA|nr:hypothetical protein MA16_Dca002714 [Dendrobium catenatum]
MNVGDNELCGVNMGVVNIDSSELNPSIFFPVTLPYLVVLVSSVGLRVNEQLVDVPIALLYANALYTHMGVRSGKNVKVQIDWLEDSSSSPFDVDEEEVFKQDGGM